MICEWLLAPFRLDTDISQTGTIYCCLDFCRKSSPLVLQWPNYALWFHTERSCQCWFSPPAAWSLWWRKFLSGGRQASLTTACCSSFSAVWEPLPCCKASGARPATCHRLWMRPADWKEEATDVKPSCVMQQCKRGFLSVGCHRSLPGWFGRSAGRPHSSPERWGWLATSPCREDGHACCWVPAETRQKRKEWLVKQFLHRSCQSQLELILCAATQNESISTANCERPQQRVQMLLCDFLELKRIKSSHKSSSLTLLPALGRGNTSSWSRGRAAGRQTGGPVDGQRYWRGVAPAAVGSIMSRV